MSTATANRIALEKLAAETGNWLRGDIDECWSYLGPPDPETAGITDHLIALNSAGYLTDQSQPGLNPTLGQDGDVWRQRAFVSFLLDRERVERVRQVTAGTELIVLISRPKRLRAHRRPDPVVVTETDGEWSSLAGRTVPRSFWLLMHAQRGWLTARALADAYQVTVVDPVWGRDDYLWPVLSPLTDVATSDGKDL